ncbi:MAG: amino acid racemase [Bacteroidales bacterium]|nr:amino acid racemase [Bacteroidales bacterium]
MNSEKIILIGGGVGPMAGVELHKKIIENTLTGGKDQEHFEIWHLSRSPDIPDRTEYLTGKINENPAEGMARTFLLMDKMLKVEKKSAVGGVTCNTFHAPEIFNIFTNILKQNDSDIKILNMIEETGNFIKDNFKNIKKIGLMSTTGTRQAGIYSNILKTFDLEILEVEKQEQAALHDTIYNLEWGIKALSPITEKAKIRFENFAQTLIDKGAEALILGCTEIPLALQGKYFQETPLIDPVYVLARALIKNANEKKLKVKQ